MLLVTPAQLYSQFALLFTTTGNTQHLSNAFNNPTPSMGVIATAFYTGLWAYDGWNNLNYVTEEIQDPSK